MVSQTLRNVRAYEEAMDKKRMEEERPGFHLTARTGWMNDPNGFSFYKGEYHLFYQYHPFDSHWGPMHWGHAVSMDLLHWKYLPAALAPDQDYDRMGCFSGSAVALEDGRHLLMYTGVRKETQPNGELCDVQVQCAAVGDGTDYKKYVGNPVLDQRDLPEGGSKFDFRDPKIWKTLDGSFRCVIGNCTEEKDGQILLYRSMDGIRWTFEKVLISNQKRFGKMWECPDFFGLDGKQVLLVSPQDMTAQGLEYHGGNGTVCLIGTYDEETENFTEEKNQAIDYGIDFYAPQTVLAPDGRRIMIGWMQNWDTSSLHSSKEAWFGQMSLPRELSIKEGRLIQQPIRELKQIRKIKVQLTGIHLSKEVKLAGVQGRRADIELSVRAKNAAEIYRTFAVHFAENETYRTSVWFYPFESVLKLDRTFSGTRRDIVHQRSCLVQGKEGEIQIRIILDYFSVEVFVNNGQQVLSAVIDTDRAAEEISFFAEGEAEMDINFYSLEIEKEKE